MKNREIRYYKDGVSLGVAFSDVDFQPGSVVFPHIATKNCKLLVNFGAESSEEAEQWM